MMRWFLTPLQRTGPEPIQQGDTVTINLEFMWPKSFARIVNGGMERLHWHFETPIAVNRLEYLVVLAPETGVARDLKYTLQGLNSPPEQRSEAGSWRVEGAEDNPPVGKRIGITLDASSE